jgi:hypothetical protein
LTLPTALRHPTPYGQTLGDVRLLVLGRKGAGKTRLANILLEGNEDIVEVGAWEDTIYGMTIRASTSWLEHQGAEGLERFEPSKNVTIVEISGYNENDHVETLLHAVTNHIEPQFRKVLEILDPQSMSPLVADLISSPSTPLYTALIILAPKALSQLELDIIKALGSYIPLILLPPIATNHRAPSYNDLHVSTFRPSNADALREGLFRSPETLAALRAEAAERFLVWRNTAHKDASPPALSRRSTVTARPKARHRPSERASYPKDVAQSKVKWEAELEPSVSRGTVRRARIDPMRPEPARGPPVPLDPLHIPSILRFSISLLSPLKERILGLFTTRGFASPSGSRPSGDPRRLVIGMAVLGAFCAGIGIGIVMRSSR